MRNFNLLEILSLKQHKRGEYKSSFEHLQEGEQIQFTFDGTPSELLEISTVPKLNESEVLRRRSEKPNGSFFSKVLRRLTQGNVATNEQNEVIAPQSAARDQQIPATSENSSTSLYNSVSNLSRHGQRILSLLQYADLQHLKGYRDGISHFAKYGRPTRYGQQGYNFLSKFYHPLKEKINSRREERKSRIPDESQSDNRLEAPMSLDDMLRAKRMRLQISADEQTVELRKKRRQNPTSDPYQRPIEGRDLVAGGDIDYSTTIYSARANPIYVHHPRDLQEHADRILISRYFHGDFHGIVGIKPFDNPILRNFIRGLNAPAYLKDKDRMREKVLNDTEIVLRNDGVSYVIIYQKPTNSDPNKIEMQLNEQENIGLASMLRGIGSDSLFYPIADESRAKDVVRRSTEVFNSYLAKALKSP